MTSSLQPYVPKAVARVDLQPGQCILNEPLDAAAPGQRGAAKSNGVTAWTHGVCRLLVIRSQASGHMVTGCWS